MSEKSNENVETEDCTKEAENSESAECTKNTENDENAGNPENSEISETSELEDVRQKLALFEDKYYRLAAEYDNYKKRTQREKDARYADALINTVSDILPAVDNLERALQVEVSSEDAKKVLDGVSMVLRQINEAFSKMNVTPIDALGKEFNPELHNAVMHIEDDGLGENTIAEELMKGYIYKNERVVRHSMVKVAN